MSEKMITTRSVDADNLFAGNVMPVITDSVTLKGGSVYLRGMVVGLDGTGKASIVDSTKADGTESPYGIVTDNIDATDGDVSAVLYLTGEFNADALIFKDTDTIEKFKTKLRNIGIFAKKTNKA